MVSVVVPFHEGKHRLELADGEREAIGLAMLGDVLAACLPVGRTLLVTDDAGAAGLGRELGVELHDDPGGGQGAAVASALASLDDGPALVVNADVPCAVPRDLRTLLGAIPPGGIALVEADDGTTNALALAEPSLFAPLYGAASATRFRDHAAALGVDAITAVVPNVADDVDTLDDLRRVALRAGPRTLATMSTLGLAA